jgi:hypothetical protein
MVASHVPTRVRTCAEPGRMSRKRRKRGRQRAVVQHSRAAPRDLGTQLTQAVFPLYLHMALLAQPSRASLRQHAARVHWSGAEDAF